jgi:hypothetical protein
MSLALFPRLSIFSRFFSLIAFHCALRILPRLRCFRHCIYCIGFSLLEDTAALMKTDFHFLSVTADSPPSAFSWLSDICRRAGHAFAFLR